MNVVRKDSASERGSEGGVELVKPSSVMPAVPAVPEGELAPPSAVPVPPPGLTKLGQTARYVPPSMPRPGNNRFWTIEAWDEPDPDLNWVNYNKLVDERKDEDRKLRQGDFSMFEKEGPLFTSRRPPLKNMPEFMHWFGLPTVSERIFNIFFDLDPNAIRAQPLDFVFKNGEQLKYYFMHITRIMPVIDYANSWIEYKRSQVRAGRDEGEYDRPSNYISVRLMPDIPEEYHCFRHENPHPIFRGSSTADIYISTAIKDRIEALRPKVKYIKIQDPGYWVSPDRDNPSHYNLLPARKPS